MSEKAKAERALEQGKGIFRLAPTWVPRSFCVPGRRIKLHPDDYYALGSDRGGLDERWFASTTPADNGPLTAPNEGLSFIVFEDNGKSETVLLRDAVEELKSELLGNWMWNEYKQWPMFSKFFDNMGPLPHHIHQRDEHVNEIGLLGKPEAYYFPPQVNNHGGDFPYTFFGLNPDTEKEEVLEVLKSFTAGDNKILNLSRCYKLEPGTGWDVPPGLLHAPGSLCTYEPQRASDVFAMYQSLVNDQLIDKELLWKNTPDKKVGDYEHLLEVIDWELNIDPNLVKNRFMEPIPVRDSTEMETEGYRETWIVYKSEDFSAKELTVFPGRTVTIKDSAPYGFIMMQGHGTLDNHDIETPALIRYGQLTYDEYFVTENKAKEGVVVSNPSQSDPIVMLKHFGPKNPDLRV